MKERARKTSSEGIRSGSFSARRRRRKESVFNLTGSRFLLFAGMMAALRKIDGVWHSFL